MRVAYLFVALLNFTVALMPPIVHFMTPINLLMAAYFFDRWKNWGNSVEYDFGK